MAEPLAVVQYDTERTDRGALALDDGHLVVYWSDGHVDPARKDAAGRVWHTEHNKRLRVVSRSKHEAAAIIALNVAVFQVAEARLLLIEQSRTSDAWAGEVSEALDGGAAPRAEIPRLIGWVGQQYAKTVADLAEVTKERDIALDAFHRCRKERDEWRVSCERAADDENANAADLETLARIVGAALVAASLTPGESLADPPSHAIVAALETARIDGARAMRDHIAAWLMTGVPARVYAEGIGGTEYTCAAGEIEKMDPATVARSNQ